MSFHSGFFNSFNSDRTYDSVDFTRCLDGIITNGCFPNDTGLLVTANPEPIGSNPPSVIIKPGKAYLNGMWFMSDSDYEFVLGTSQLITPNQIHLVYLCFDTTESAREVRLEHKVGSSPTVPTDGAGKYYLPLASIADQMSSQPGPSNITDTRMYAGVSGTGITTPSLVDSCVTNEKLGPLVVSSGKIADNAVIERTITSGAVTNSKLGTYAVSSGRIADNAVIERTINSSAVTNSKIGKNSVSMDKLGTNAFRAQGVNAYYWENIDSSDTVVNVGNGDSAEYTHNTGMPRLRGITANRNMQMLVTGFVTVEYTATSSEPLIGLAIFNTTESSFSNKKTELARTLGSARIVNIGSIRRETLPVTCFITINKGSTYNLRLGLGSSLSGNHVIIGYRTHIASLVIPTGDY